MGWWEIKNIFLNIFELHDILLSCSWIILEKYIFIWRSIFVSIEHIALLQCLFQCSKPSQNKMEKYSPVQIFNICWIWSPNETMVIWSGNYWVLDRDFISLNRFHHGEWWQLCFWFHEGGLKNNVWMGYDCSRLEFFTVFNWKQAILHQW